MYRPPVGVPRREQSRWQGWIASLLAHLLLLLLVIIPTMEPAIDYGHREGAGGAGPAGGGGGGLGDEGAPHVQFVQVAPAHAAAPPTAPPVQPVPKPVTPTVAPPPLPVTPKPVAPRPVTTPTAPTAANAVATAGPTGAGTGLGKTGGAGAGPGGGGGVGSGVGPGVGSGTGPGTGGGNAKNYPPTPKQFFLPPMPAPAAVRGKISRAWFDVDSTGKATLLRFEPTPDGGYNKQLHETLLQIRFRPAVRPDGTPVRDTAEVIFSF